jgi:hypothetical protein
MGFVENRALGDDGPNAGARQGQGPAAPGVGQRGAGAGEGAPGGLFKHLIASPRPRSYERSEIAPSIYEGWNRGRPRRTNKQKDAHSRFGGSRLEDCQLLAPTAVYLDLNLKAPGPAAPNCAIPPNGTPLCLLEAALVSRFHYCQLQDAGLIWAWA